MEVLYHMELYGFHVLVCIADGASINLRVFKMLADNIDPVAFEYVIVREPHGVVRGDATGERGHFEQLMFDLGVSIPCTPLTKNGCCSSCLIRRTA